MATLSIDFDGRQREVPVDTDAFTIGRDPGNSLVIEHTGVSRQHCRLVRQGEAFEVEDLGSAGGTRIDGQRVTRAPIRPGQVLAVGPARLTLNALAPASKAAPAAAEWALYAVVGPHAGTAFCFAGPVRIGRAADCDLVLDGTEVSAEHCELAPVEDGCELRDLGSTNGTRVDGRSVRDGRLLGGEHIELGAHAFRFDRYPLPPVPSALVSWAIELALATAILLLLWGLTARLVLRPLLGANPGGDPQAVPFTALDTAQRPRHYAFWSSGDFEISVLKADGLLRVMGASAAHQELRVVLAAGRPATSGWRVRGRIEAVLGSLEVTLVGYYRDAAGEIVAVLHSAPLPLAAGQRETVEVALPPLEGAQWVQPGYLVRGPLREARLGPLSPEPAELAPLASASLRLAGLEARLLPAGQVELTGVARVEPAVMSKDGELLTSTRHLVPASPRSQPDGISLEAVQLGLGGERFPYSLHLGAKDDSLAARFSGGQATHLRWCWTEPADRVELYYQGLPRLPGETRPLLDELVVSRSGADDRSVRLSPPVYLDGRWLDAAGREVWQLQLADSTRRHAIELSCRSGNRQRERELRRVRQLLDRAVAAGELPTALHHLARARSLAPPGDAELGTLQGQVESKGTAYVEGLIADQGAGSLSRLVAGLDELRGTAYEDDLEQELTRRILAAPALPGELAARLLEEGRYLVAYGYHALGRAALQLVVQVQPDSEPARQALRLLAALPP